LHVEIWFTFFDIFPAETDKFGEIKLNQTGFLVRPSPLKHYVITMKNNSMQQVLHKKYSQLSHNNWFLCTQQVIAHIIIVRIVNNSFQFFPEQIEIKSEFFINKHKRITR
jgi:hypothetical protein